ASGGGRAPSVLLSRRSRTMAPWLPGWGNPAIRSSRRRQRSWSRSRPCRLWVEELESRLTPSTSGVAGLNLPLTTDPGVQQMPSIAVAPLNSQHLVVSYMDLSLVQTGYAGIGVAVSRDGGDSWERSSVPLAAGFDDGAGQPITRFDDQGHVFVTFMASRFL